MAEEQNDPLTESPEETLPEGLESSPPAVAVAVAAASSEPPAGPAILDRVKLNE